MGALYLCLSVGVCVSVHACVGVITAFVRSLYLAIKKGLHAHAERGWPNKGRERVSTHVILVNEFRQSFFIINEYFSSYCSELVA